MIILIEEIKSFVTVIKSLEWDAFFVFAFLIAFERVLVYSICLRYTVCGAFHRDRIDYIWTQRREMNKGAM